MREFRPTRNKFLLKLRKDIKSIKKTKELLVNADKFTNIYKMSKEDYHKHLRNNITTTYKNSNRNRVNDINLDAKIFLQKLEIDDRVEKTQETEAFLTRKDHKEGFQDALSFCLINSSKSDIGKISKSLLDTRDENILKQSNLNQWKNTAQVITWSKDFKSKNAPSFVNFNVENLSKDAISYAKTITNINDDQLSIIMQSKKTLLFNNNEPWVENNWGRNL